MDSPQIAPPTAQVDKRKGNSYLSFYLNEQTPALLKMEYTQEVIIVPATRIALMPNMPECVLGLLNRRSRVLWVVNLAKLLNLPVTEQIFQQYQLVIIQVGQVKLGLAVQLVKGVTHFSSPSKPSAELFAKFAPYVSGCISQEKEALMVLDAEKIANSPDLQPH